MLKTKFDDFTETEKHSQQETNNQLDQSYSGKEDFFTINPEAISAYESLIESSENINLGIEFLEKPDLNLQSDPYLENGANLTKAGYSELEKLKYYMLYHSDSFFSSFHLTQPLFVYRGLSNFNVPEIKNFWLKFNKNKEIFFKTQILAKVEYFFDWLKAIQEAPVFIELHDYILNLMQEEYDSKTARKMLRMKIEKLSLRDKMTKNEYWIFLNQQHVRKVLPHLPTSFLQPFKS